MDFSWANKIPGPFFPVCQINKEHYLKSLQNKNIGTGINLSLYNFSYDLSILHLRNRSILLNPPANHYPLDGVYILPVHLRYKKLEHDSPVRYYSANFKLKDGEIIKSYASSSMTLDTIVFLPYAP